MVRITEQDYPSEATGALTGKALQAMSAEEVVQYNIDYDRLMDEEESMRAARFLEMGRETFFELTRHIMSRANQQYGGSLSSGDEIGIRMIRPDDMEMGVTVTTGLANSWQFTWDTLNVDDIFGTAGDPINLADDSDAEGLLIVAWSNNHPAPKIEAIRGNKFGRALYVHPLPWDLLAAERGEVKVMEANPWFIAFPGEDFHYDGNIFATGADVLRAVGVFVGPGTEIRAL